MNIDAIRRLLAIADPTRDPYAVAQVAITILTANPSDVAARSHYARALTELKLLAAAQRLVGIPETGGGSLAWPSRARRFAANLRALEAKDAIGAAIVKEAAQELPRYELHQSADGNFQVLDKQFPAHAPWLALLEDHKAATKLWQYDRGKIPVPSPIIFHGLGFGWLFLHMLATTEKTFVNYSCAAHVVDGDPLAIAMLLHMHDFQESISHPRTHWYIRPTADAALAAFRQTMSQDKTLTIPQQFIRCAIRPTATLPLEETIQQIARDRNIQRMERVGENNSSYADKDAIYWAARFDDALAGRAEKLRILAITSRHTTVLQHSMAEMQAAIQSRFAETCEVKLAIEPDDHSFENPFIDLIAEFKPDLIFQISRLRYENPNIPPNIPFLCWDQDSLPCMRTEQATASLNPLTYVAGHGAVFGFTSLKWPRDNCIFVHPAGATFRYHNGAVAPELRAQHACDISYVSNASGTPESLAEQTRARWKPHAAWLQLFNEAAQIVLTESDAGKTWDYVALKYLLRKLAHQNAVTLEPEPWREMTSDLNVYTDRCFRHSTLNWVSKWAVANQKTLRLYGRGWENHATLAQHAAGIAEPGEHARAIFQSTRINLQLIEPGFIHSRSLDGLAAGGFFLTRSTPTDGLNIPAVKTLYELARYTVENSINSDEELAAIADPKIQTMIASTKAYYLSHEVQEPMWRSLQVWAQAPAAALLFPQLGAITFHDEKSFGNLAGHFLSNEPARRTLADEMRRLVEEKFSYSARWTTFLDSVHAGLTKAAAPTLALAAGV